MKISKEKLLLFVKNRDTASEGGKGHLVPNFLFVNAAQKKWQGRLQEALLGGSKPR